MPATTIEKILDVRPIPPAQKHGAATFDYLERNPETWPLTVTRP